MAPARTLADSSADAELALSELSYSDAARQAAAGVQPDASARPVFASRRELREYERAMAGSAEAAPSLPPGDAQLPEHPQQAPTEQLAPPFDGPRIAAPEESAIPAAAAPASAIPEQATPSGPTLPPPTRRPQQSTRRPARRVAPVAVEATPARKKRRSRLRGAWAKAIVAVAALGLVGTAAIPSYAIASVAPVALGTNAAAQTLTVSNSAKNSAARDSYSVLEAPGALDSTQNENVSPTVQALAKQLMSEVAAGRLTGTTPDHIFEIQYLAEGRAVPGCGVDYRVLQTIQVALNDFGTVGVSDINRRCTGQIEGAGSASAHYANGGGHAVDFFELDGQALDGGDAKSLELIHDLDPIMPADTNLGQIECRPSISLEHFVPFDDTCNHVHIDFGDAKAAALSI